MSTLGHRASFSVTGVLIMGPLAPGHEGWLAGDRMDFLSDSEQLWFLLRRTEFQLCAKKNIRTEFSSSVIQKVGRKLDAAPGLIWTAGGRNDFFGAGAVDSHASHRE